MHQTHQPTNDVPLSDALAALSLHPSDSSTAPVSLDLILLADSISAVQQALPHASALLLTGLDRHSRRAVIRHACPSSHFLSVSSLTSPSFPSDSVIPTSSVLVFDDIDLPSTSLNSLLTSHFTTSLLTRRTIIGLASSHNAIPSALLRSDRFARHIRLTAPSASCRTAFWHHVLSALSHPVSAAPKLSDATPAHTALDLLRLMHLALSTSTTPDVDTLLALASTSATVSPPHSTLPFIKPAPCRTGRWTAHVGYSHAKDRLLRLVQWPLSHGPTFTRLGTTAPRGVLLHGPSGCGKTLLARALLARVSVNGFVAHASDIFAGYLGESERRVRSLFAAARAAAPAVIVLDDLEVVGATRAFADGGGGSGVEARVLGTLLAEMDGIEGGQVFVLGCTRDVHALDPALVRPGRMDHLVEIGLPGHEDRIAILEKVLQHTPVGVDDSEKQTVVQELAFGTDGFSGADLEALCREAGLLAMENEVEPTSVHSDYYQRALVSIRRTSAEEIECAEAEQDDAH